jgi:hypothetical protein
LQVQTPALALDQLLAVNSAAHRLDALKHVMQVPQLKILELEDEIKAIRLELENDTGESNADFRQNF